jgi:hypothetical protein
VGAAVGAGVFMLATVLHIFFANVLPITSVSDFEMGTLSRKNPGTL